MGMITAVDTNILVLIVAGVEPEASVAELALKRAGNDGVLVLPVVCYAELASQFGRKSDLDDFLRSSSFNILDLKASAAHLAGVFYKAYRRRGGSRTRILADFLIGAQAQVHADRLLTNDVRFFSDTFADLIAISALELA